GREGRPGGRAGRGPGYAEPPRSHAGGAQAPRHPGRSERRPARGVRGLPPLPLSDAGPMARVVGHVDVPCEGTVVDTRRQLVVGGWVYGHDEPVTVVEVHLEDQLLGRVVADGSRPDVAAALGTSGAE